MSLVTLSAAGSERSFPNQAKLSFHCVETGVGLPSGPGMADPMRPAVGGWSAGWWIGRSAAGRGVDNGPGASWFVHPDPESASARGPQFSWPTRVLRFRCEPGESLPC
jgi:hypothetical protein